MADELNVGTVKVGFEGDRAGLEEAKRQVRELADAVQSGQKSITPIRAPVAGGAADALRRAGASDEEISRLLRGVKGGLPPGGLGSPSSGMSSQPPGGSFLVGGTRGITGRLVEQLRSNPDLARAFQRPGPADSVIAGMSEAGRDATAGRQMIAGMSMPGRQLKEEEKQSQEAMKARERERKALEGTTESTRQLGMRQAWLIRSARSGGPFGAIGGGVGALAGLLSPGGNAGFGALIGNQIGQHLGQGLAFGQSVVDRAAAASPAAAYQRERAEADALASEGRLYMETYRATTELTKRWRDFAASGGRTLSGTAAEAFAKLGNAFSDMELNALTALQGTKVQEGAGVGAHTADLQGQFFSSGSQVYRAIASRFMTRGESSKPPDSARLFKGTPTQEMAHDIFGAPSRGPFAAIPMQTEGGVRGRMFGQPGHEQFVPADKLDLFIQQKMAQRNDDRRAGGLVGGGFAATQVGPAAVNTSAAGVIAGGFAAMEMIGPQVVR